MTDKATGRPKPWRRDHDKEALKPCPFCGGPAAIEVGLASFVDVEIVCEGCGSSGGNYDCTDGMHDGDAFQLENEQAAIKAWNHRPAEEALAQERDRQAENAERFATMIDEGGPYRARAEASEQREAALREAAGPFIRYAQIATTHFPKNDGWALNVGAEHEAIVTREDMDRLAKLGIGESE